MCNASSRMSYMVLDSVYLPLGHSDRFGVQLTEIDIVRILTSSCTLNMKLGGWLVTFEAPFLARFSLLFSTLVQPFDARSAESLRVAALGLAFGERDRPLAGTVPLSLPSALLCAFLAFICPCNPPVSGLPEGSTIMSFKCGEVETTDDSAVFCFL